MNLSLDRIKQFYSLLPPYTRPTVHVAGTNGKGSVCAIVSSILRSANPPLSVGCFNSPHLVSVYDSITINGDAVSPETYESTQTHIQSVGKENRLEVTNFELLTLTALAVFEQAQVDIVVLEVGMGGRLDATNIIPDSCVVVSALCAVDLDHQAFLGNTVAAIATEKASIARPGKPFVLGRQKHAEVEDTCRDVVEGVGGELVGAVRVGQGAYDANFSLNSPPSPRTVTVELPCFSEPFNALFPLHGEHQLDNLGLATTIISVLLSHPSCSALGFRQRLDPVTVAQGISRAQWPGRLSFHMINKPSKLLILADGAHNPASSETLARYIEHLSQDVKLLTGRPRTIWITYILGLSHSPPKTPLQTLSPLLPPKPSANSDVEIKFRVASVGFSPPEGMPWVKCVSPVDIKDTVQQLCPEAEVWVADEDEEKPLPLALQWAATRSPGENHLVVLAGSLYLVADFYRMLRQ
ncbi:folylpolyglutamate synthase [Moniliophthora roreri MCA 2997]|uniref:Folylpolyglutamate synthase n=2 Tax=Moniliophthora roreri TaxID=221103 RepID=V2XTD0_MONRO|nr:folylpolyglutamate synthase [Moniliophthora roreri MCA 2997]KAI3616208.1 folylpolyglutamate synthase [Moniliophthora roreri]